MARTSNAAPLPCPGVPSELFRVRDVSKSIGRLFALLALIVIPCATSHAQGTNKPSTRAANTNHNIIRPEYYAALDFYDDGQIMQASEVLQQALASSRQSGQQYGIDAVPSLVMLGECLYQQGDIASALEYYDLAMSTSLQCAGWLDLIQPNPILEKNETKGREIAWGGLNSRNAPYQFSNDVVGIALGASDLLIETSSGRGVIGTIVGIDATEILRCQAIALRRRYCLLGPLALHNPLTPALPQLFNVPNGLKQIEPFRSSLSICQCLAQLPMENANQLIVRLKQSLSLSSGADHALTAVALLALAELSLSKQDIAAAEEFAIEASLTAARGEQCQHLEEAVEMWSHLAYQNGRDLAATNKVIQAVNKWSISKSRLVSIRSQVELVRQSAFHRDVESVKKQAPNVLRLLMPKQITLPRMDATIYYAQSLVAFAEGDITQGVQKLDECLSLVRGSSPMNSASRRLFQAALLVRLLESNQLSADVGVPLLSEVVNGDSHAGWLTQPIEELLFLTSEKSSAWNQLLPYSLNEQSNENQLVMWNAYSNYRYRQTSLLSGRLADVRRVLHVRDDSRSAAALKQIDRIQKSFPAVVQNREFIQARLAPLKNSPKWDTRKWTEDESRRWEEAMRRCASQESLLWAIAISPAIVPVDFPWGWKPEELSRSLAKSDALIQWAIRDGTLYGYLWDGKEWNRWTVPPSSNWLAKMTEVRNAIRSGIETEPGARKKINELEQLLFPQKIWSRLIAKQRWIFVPDGMLWQFPWESLPLNATGDMVPLISEHAVVYVPTLGSIETLLTDKRNKSATGSQSVLYLQHEFGANGKEINRSIRERMAKSFSHCGLIESNQIQNAPSSLYVKLFANQMISVTPAVWGDPNQFVLAMDRSNTQGVMSAWNPLPSGTPHSMWLFGVDSSVNQLLEGDEWMRWTLSLISQGTRQITVSRWRVDGESPAFLMEALNENCKESRTSAAWQRAVASLWIEQFEIATGAGETKSVSGSLPMLWSGYMTIGDTSIEP